MRTGEHRRSRQCRSLYALGNRLAQRGFSYVLLLFMIVLAGTALAALGQQWQLQAQRQREAELLFRGLQLRDALLRYAAATPAGQPRSPRTLDELLRDSRRERPQHHLRRLWPDPFTGRADWVLLRDQRGGITGLHSADQRPALRRHGLPDGLVAAGDSERALRVADWVFAAAATPTFPRSSQP